MIDRPQRFSPSMGGGSAILDGPKVVFYGDVAAKLSEASRTASADRMADVERRAGVLRVELAGTPTAKRHADLQAQHVSVIAMIEAEQDVAAQASAEAKRQLVAGLDPSAKVGELTASRAKVAQLEAWSEEISSELRPLLKVLNVESGIRLAEFFDAAYAEAEAVQTEFRQAMHALAAEWLPRLYAAENARAKCMAAARQHRTAAGVYQLHQTPDPVPTGDVSQALADLTVKGY